jgi:hypothetical protein
MKVSLPTPNIANAIAERIADKFPELADDPIGGIWFTGSNVWSLLYPDQPVRERDWDIFAVSEQAAHRVAVRLSLAANPACRTKDKRHHVPKTISAAHVPNLAGVRPTEDVDSEFGPSYGGGYCYATDRGEVDLWISTPGDVLGELQTYPTGSHAHCRAAFSFTDGLIVLPNECAATVNELAQGRDVCPGCKREIDPDTCHCGSASDYHNQGSGHTPVPMGCECHHLDHGAM